MNGKLIFTRRRRRRKRPAQAVQVGPTVTYREVPGGAEIVLEAPKAYTDGLSYPPWLRGRS